MRDAISSLAPLAPATAELEELENKHSAYVRLRWALWKGTSRACASLQGGRFSSYHHDRLLVGCCTWLFLGGHFNLGKP